MTARTYPEAILRPIEDAFRSIGYRPSLIKKNYTYSDFIARKPTTRTISLAVFGQDPPDYRSACFGIETLHDHPSPESIIPNLRSLGAPGIIVIRNGRSEWWINRETNISFWKVVDTKDLAKLIKSHSEDWNPERMIRLKSGIDKPRPQQLDFIDLGLLPALEHQASAKIDSLISRVIYDAKKLFQERGLPLDDATVFRILFGLLTAKVLKDHEVATSCPIDLSDPLTALEAVSNYYREPKNRYKQNFFPAELLQHFASEIRDSFSLKNLSIDTLAYVYENTFVSKESRQKWGIHSTPSYIADYMMAQLPFESISKSQWRVFDPMCGHGIFLIAAMRRMRNLLPSGWGGRQRHRFFTERLRGVDIDSFSIEVARLCLTMADFPESDGWDLGVKDIFEGTTLETATERATIIVGNPPFEILKGEKPDSPKPKELLRRVLPALTDGSLFGFVLPHSFLDSNDYKNERSIFARFFQILSVTTLPDRMFKYSGAETVLFIARKAQTPSGLAKTSYKHVNEKDRLSFRLRSTTTFEDLVPASCFRTSANFYLPPFRELWERLAHNPSIQDIADVKTGVQFEPNQTSSELVQLEPFPESMLGIFDVNSSFEQYVFSAPVYMSVRKEHRRKAVPGAWNYDWKKPKVIIPKSRMSRGPWRFAAVIDKSGLIVSRRFFAVWPKTDDVGIEYIAALLNSPVAQAFVYTHSPQRDIPRRIYNQIPIPKNVENLDRIMKGLVDQYVRSVISEDWEMARKNLIRIDTELLRHYKLPRRYEKEILDMLSVHKRPVSCGFNGYKIQEVIKPKADIDLLERGVTEEAMQFCLRRRIRPEDLRKTLEIVQESFPAIVDSQITPEYDPDTEEEWLLIDITVDSDSQELSDCYDQYVSRFVTQVPTDIQEDIRLSYDLM